jgi:hypothetical protein
MELPTVATVVVVVMDITVVVTVMKIWSNINGNLWCWRNLK